MTVIIDGTLGINKVQDGVVTPANLTQPLTLETAKPTTSGTSIDFTAIPAWVKRITVMFNGVSVVGATDQLIQLGTSSGLEITGYLSCSEAATYTAGFGIRNSTPAWTIKGIMYIVNMGSNTWVMSSNLYMDTGTTMRSSAGTKTLAGTLDRLRLTNVGGTDTFDAGSVNIMYEG